MAGSHSTVPKADRGWAYQREMELLAECGLSPIEVITAATRNNAEFFRVSGRLGTIEPGKLADLVLLAGDPLNGIPAMRQVERVMLNGGWITLTRFDKNRLAGNGRAQMSWEPQGPVELIRQPRDPAANPPA